jgi:hypothetical protein
MAELMGLLGGAGGQEGAPDIDALLGGLISGSASDQADGPDLGSLLRGLLGGSGQ